MGHIKSSARSSPENPLEEIYHTSTENPVLLQKPLTPKSQNPVGNPILICFTKSTTNFGPPSENSVTKFTTVLQKTISQFFPPEKSSLPENRITKFTGKRSQIPPEKYHKFPIILCVCHRYIFYLGSRKRPQVPAHAGTCACNYST